MSHFSWESEVIDQMQVEPQPEAQTEPQQDTVLETMPEALVEPEPPQALETPQATPPDPAALAMSVDDFSALEDRILRAVNLVKRERLARAEAEERAIKAEALVADQTPKIEHLQTEVNTLRSERDHVRQRVERLLSQLDALEL
jgi:FtsZ-binding cell division protein ZapB